MWLVLLFAYCMLSVAAAVPNSSYVNTDGPWSPSPPLHRNFDAMYYINLPYRVDRRTEMEAELRKWGWENDTIRVEGVHVPERGALGCTQSHIKVLQRFLADPSLKHALIMEDDVEFAYDPRPAVTRFLRDYGDHGWDAIMLAANGKLTLPHNEYLDKLVLAYTTAAYAITRDTAVKLLPIFIESERRLKIAMSYNNALDKLWEAEQVNGDWYTFVPKLATQRKSYSDVEKFVVTYGV